MIGSTALAVVMCGENLVTTRDEMNPALARRETRLRKQSSPLCSSTDSGRENIAFVRLCSGKNIDGCMRLAAK